MPRKATKMKVVSVRAQVGYEKRRMAVEALSQGEVASDVARVMKIPRRTLFNWIARYRHGGEHALQDRHKSGRPRKAEAKVLQLSDFTLGTHPISTKGTTQVSGAKRRSDFELFTLSLPLFSTLFFSLWVFF